MNEEDFNLADLNQDGEMEVEEVVEALMSMVPQKKSKFPYLVKKANLDRNFLFSEHGIKFR